MTEKEGKIIAGISSVAVLSLAILSVYYVSKEIEEENKKYENDFYGESIKEEDIKENVVLPESIQKDGEFLKVYNFNNEKNFYRVYDKDINEYIIYELKPQDIKKKR